MRIESTAIALRRREPWEAIDLGFAMLRQWWYPVYAVWGMTFIPVAGALVYAFRDEPLIAALLLWWLKPVFDRLVLHVLSRAVFGEVLPVPRVAADWREYLSPGLIPGQLWGRVDLARSFDLPVWQLERVTGPMARRRRSVLQRRARYHAVWLTGMCAIFESIVFLGLLLVVSELATPVKASSGWIFEGLFGPGSALEGWGVGATLAYAAAITTIEPFYVAGGFSLYLNRRTLLEGWDIELELRRCTARFGNARPGATLLVGALVALVSWSVLPLPTTAAAATPAQSVRQEIAEVLKDPEFPHQHETWSWRMRWPEWNFPDWLTWPDWLRFNWGGANGNPGLVTAVTEVARLLLWVAAAALLLWLLYHLARKLPYLMEPDPERVEPPRALFGLDIAPESLPADIAGTAARLLSEGEMREALSLLYRGALSSLVHVNGMALQAGDTERDCFNRARALLPGKGLEYFGELIVAWQAAAYAGKFPDAAHAQDIVSAWPTHFMPATE